FIW
ncbi:hypothetical protein N499_1335B, partial [Wolbachia pipientis wVitA]